MFTTIDKALAAVIGGLVSFFALQFGTSVDFLTPDMVGMLSAFAAGVLAYLVPNKEPPV